VVATSAVRDATNPEVFFAGMAARLGVRPVVIPGVEEARLSFVGALSGVTVENAPVLVMDIGGGSTELVIGGLDGTIWGAASLDAGSVRLTERFGLTGPTPSERRDAATAYVDRLLDGLDGLDGFDGALAAVGSWIGVAGTVTTLSAIRQGLGSYDRDRVHGSVVEAEQLSTLVDQLAALSVSEIRALGPVEAGRADVITAGALIAERFGRRVGGIMVVSETDLLDGVALELLRS
ncbi:MAG: exopolyphosphatase, partial [Microlunatus sp.]|nr:exopolyphosphatase [Microlunatus sp.]